MKDTKETIGYCQLSLGLLYEDSTEYESSKQVYPVSTKISQTKETNKEVKHNQLLETVVEVPMIMCGYKVCYRKQ